VVACPRLSVRPQVRCSPRVFCQEFTFNVFGLLSLPLMVPLVSFHGVQNRWFLPVCRRPAAGREDAFSKQPIIPCCPCIRVRSSIALSLHQLFHIGLVIAMNALFMSVTPMRRSVTIVEIVLANALVLLRAATVAVKYAFFSRAEYNQTMAPPDQLPDSQKRSKLVLGGWLRPDESLLYLEMERSMARNCPGIDTMTITFPSDTARLRALSTMVGSLPGYLRNEGPAVPPRCRAFLQRVVDGAEVDDLLEHDARLLDREVGSEQIRASPAGALLEDRRRSSVETAEDGPRLESTTSRVLPRAAARAAKIPPSKPELYDQRGLATVPSKLVLWHQVLSAHGMPLSSPWFQLVPQVCGGLFAALPTILRLSLGGLPMMVRDWGNPMEIALLVVTVMVSSINARITLSFCMLGAWDLWRRLEAQKALYRLIDPRSSLTVEMHDASVRADTGAFFGAMGLCDTRLKSDATPDDPISLIRRRSSAGVPRTTISAWGAAFDAESHKVLEHDGKLHVPEQNGKLASIRPAVTVAEHAAESDPVRTRIVAQATWLRPEDARRMVEERVAHLRLPTLYPENLLAWLQIRHCLTDLGRAYQLRIQVYTAFFAFTVACLVITSFAVLFGWLQSFENQIIVLTLGAYGDLLFGTTLVLQMVVASNVNRSVAFQRRRLNRFEALSLDTLCSRPLDESTRERLKQCRKVLSLLAKSLDSEGDLNPARVMFIRADFALVVSFLSVAGSGILAALSQLQQIKWVAF
jgi:hypothetical protein